MNRVRAPLILMLILTAGCLPPERPDLFSRLERQELIEVTVENTRPSDADIYAYWENRGTRVHVGVVEGFQTRTFTTPWWSGGVKFQRSERLRFYEVRPGDRLALVIGGATSWLPQRVRN